MIATMALKHDCAVLTIDRHFEVIPDLICLNG